MTNNDSETRKQAIINSAVEQVRGLLETHYSDVCKSAEKEFVGDERTSKPNAKVSFRVEWPVIAQAALVRVKIGYGFRASDESEEEVDPLQSKLELPDDDKFSPAAKVAAKRLVDTVRKAGATMTIKTGDAEATVQ